MKVLGIIGVVVSVIALGLGAYLQFSVVPAAEDAELRIEISSNTYDGLFYEAPGYQADQDIVRSVVPAGEMVLLAGGIAFLLSIVPAIKKQNIAWIGVVIGLGTLLLGAAHGTHMFS